MTCLYLDFVIFLGSLIFQEHFNTNRDTNLEIAQNKKGSTDEFIVEPFLC